MKSFEKNTSAVKNVRAIVNFSMLRDSPFSGLHLSSHAATFSSYIPSNGIGPTAHSFPELLPH